MICYCHGHNVMAIGFLATQLHLSPYNFIATQLNSLPYNYIATISISAFTISCYQDGRGKCLCCNNNERCDSVVLPCLATNKLSLQQNQWLQRPILKWLQELIATRPLATIGNQGLLVVITHFHNQMGHIAMFFHHCARGKFW